MNRYITMPSYYQNLTSLEGKKGIYSILLTATVLTIFEIVFFYKIVSPSVNQQMESGIKKLGQVIAGMIKDRSNSASVLSSKLQGMINPHAQNLFQNHPGMKEELINLRDSQLSSLELTDRVRAILQTFHQRDQQINDKINRYTQLTGGLIILFLVIMMIALVLNIRGSGAQGDTSIAVATKTSLLTVAILISFQVLFFFFGKRFKYPGTVGNEEFLAVMFSAIKTN